MCGALGDGEALMKILIGLGNPGKEYEKTFHNMGFEVIDNLAKKLGVKLSKKNFKAVYGETKINGQKIILAKPQTFMNLSGESVLMFKNKFKDADIVVICDDFDLEKGKIRFRTHGSGGTHNGLRNIVNFIGQDFSRLRVGIGQPDKQIVEFVLSKMDNTFDDIIEKATDELIKVCTLN